MRQEFGVGEEKQDIDKCLALFDIAEDILRGEKACFQFPLVARSDAQMGERVCAKRLLDDTPA